MKSASQHIATGISYGASADDQHAAQAVNNALSKLKPNASMAVGSVLLFLTNGYAHQPQNAIRLAAAAAGTPVVHGACSSSVFTEEDWLLDVEGAAAMIFPVDYCWHPSKIAQQRSGASDHLLCLSSPNAADIAINSAAQPHFGSVVSDLYGHGPFSLWQSGRINEREFCHLTLMDSRHAAGSTTETAKRKNYALGIAPAVRPVSAALQINLSDANRLLEVDESSALISMTEHLPRNLIDIMRDQLSNLFVAVGNAPGKESLQAGDFTLLHVTAVDEQQQQVVLSGKVKSGRHLFWAIRDRQFAQQSMQDELNALAGKLDKMPQFALLFPNISRGSEFYAGRDRDREIFIDTFPHLPTLGFYGYAEILGSRKQTNLHHYSTLFAVFS